jgi:hypothetical protein
MAVQTKRAYERAQPSGGPRGLVAERPNGRRSR